MPIGFPNVNDESLYHGFIYTNEDRQTRIFLKKGNKKGWYRLKLRKDKFPHVSQYNRMPYSGLGERYTYFGKRFNITKELRSYTKGRQTYRDWFDTSVRGNSSQVLNKSISNIASSLYYPAVDADVNVNIIEPSSIKAKQSSEQISTPKQSFEQIPKQSFESHSLRNSPVEQPKSHPMFKLFTANNNEKVMQTNSSFKPMMFAPIVVPSDTSIKLMPNKQLDYDDFGKPFNKNLNFEKYN